MHVLQPKHTKLKPSEVEGFLNEYNVSLSQLPKIRKEDSALPEGCEVGDIVKIERKLEGKSDVFFRVVV
jgi:DNA-directed RNA polymerase subunit H